MTRRVLATLFLGAAAFALLARAEPPAGDSKDKDKAARAKEGIDEKAAVDDLRLKQEQKQRQFGEFKGALLRLSQRMAVSANPADRDKAKILKMAVEKSNEEGIEQSFDKLVSILKENQLTDANLDKALTENKELTARIRAILALLMTDNRDAELKRQIAEAQRRLEELNRIIREQQNERTRVELKRAQADQLGREQKKITTDTGNLARGVAKSSQGGEAKKGAGDAKGAGKGGEAKSAPKEDTKDPKVREKAGEPKDGKGDNKSGSKEGSKGDAKKGQGGESKAGQKGDNKSGQSGSKSGSKGEGSKSDAKGKGDGKGEGKGGEGSKSGSQGGGKGSQGGGQQAGGSKSGGQGGQKQQDGPKKDDQTPDFPGKKQIQDAEKYQKEAEKKLEEENNDAAANKQAKAIDELNKAKKALEDLLRQLRQEEIDRILAALQMRCEHMLVLQIEVRDGTVSLDKGIKERPEQKPENSDRQRSLELEGKENDIIKEGNDARRLLESEGSAVAFPVVITNVLEDMSNVAQRLRATDTGAITVTIENDIIDTLREMIEALKKARQQNNQKPPPGGGGGGGSQNQPLLDELAELKLIRSMQLRVNSRTQVYGQEYKGQEQVPAPEKAQTSEERAKAERLQKEVKQLGERQLKIYEVTDDIVKGRNK
jgi:hypothetical protein